MNNEERDKWQMAKAGRKIDDVEEMEKGRCIQKKKWTPRKQQATALLSAHVSPAQLFTQFLLDSMSSAQPSSV